MASAEHATMATLPEPDPGLSPVVHVDVPSHSASCLVELLLDARQSWMWSNRTGRRSRSPERGTTPQEAARCSRPSIS
jgi:hypothetical protein